MLVLRERDRLADAIDRRAGSENETLDAGLPRSLEQVQSPAHIRVVIQLRLADRGSDSSPRGEVGDGLEFLAMKKKIDRGAVA